MSKVKNLINESAVIKIKDLARKAGTAFLQSSLGEFPCKGRPMQLAHADDSGNLWFFSQVSSNKNAELKNDPHVHLLFARPDAGEFLCISGEAEIVFDRKRNEEYWKPQFRAWFPKGKTDPEISLICVKPVDVHYWDMTSNKAVALLKSKVASLVGMAADSSVEGALRV